jgi:hypothetical protein
LANFEQEATLNAIKTMNRVERIKVGKVKVLPTNMEGLKGSPKWGLLI